MNRLRRRVREIVEIAEPGDRTSRIFDVAIRLLIALPTAILGAAFVDELGDRRPAGPGAAPPEPAGAEERCPHCGRPLVR